MDFDSRSMAPKITYGYNPYVITYGKNPYVIPVYIRKKSVCNTCLHTEFNPYVMLILHTDFDPYVIICM